MRGHRADLRRYAAQVQRAVKKLMGTFNGVYSKVRVVPVDPNGIEYVYVFAEPKVAGSGTKEMDAYKPTLQTLFETAIAPEMEHLGFSNPTATWTYKNPDGSVLWTHTFSQR